MAAGSSQVRRTCPPPLQASTAPISSRASRSSRPTTSKAARRAREVKRSRSITSSRNSRRSGSSPGIRTALTSNECRLRASPRSRRRLRGSPARPSSSSRRSTYKYEMGAKLGAAAVLIVHETEPAAYPYAVVINSFGRETFELRSAAPNPDFPVVPAWIHLDKAKELFAASGRDFDALKKEALPKNFRPVQLDGAITFILRTRWAAV